MQNKNKELDRLNGVYMKLLNNAGVKYIEGRGKLVDAHTVEVNGKHYTVSHPSLLALSSGSGFGPIREFLMGANKVTELMHVCTSQVLHVQSMCAGMLYCRCFWVCWESVQTS